MRDSDHDKPSVGPGGSPPEIVTIVSPDGQVLYTNGAAAVVLGLPTDAPTDDALSYVHPDDADRAMHSRCWLLEEPGRAGLTVLRVRCADGWRHVETTGVNMTNTPAVGGILYITRDVEQRERAQASLSRQLAGQQLIADLGRLALILRDVDTLIGAAMARLADFLRVAAVSLVEPATPGRDASRTEVTRTGGSAPRPDSWRVDLPGTGRAGGFLSVSGDVDHLDEIDLRVTRGVAAVLASAIHRADRERQALQNALHDELTGLATRRLLTERLDRALARGDKRCAVLMIDLDRFKAVNDSYGHAAGDEVLRELGQRLAGCVRPTDTVARYGGDEFIILCEDSPSMRSIKEIARRVAGVCSAPFRLCSGETVELSSSIGIAWSDDKQIRSATALIRQADAAMYRRKPR
jgi:diguanylate cyclase (GGDEF)-like protein